MNPFLILVIVVLMGMTVISLGRGIAAFMQSTRRDLERGDETGPSPMQLKQNKLMMQRILFQAAAILVVALAVFASR